MAKQSLQLFTNWLNCVLSPWATCQLGKKIGMCVCVCVCVCQLNAGVAEKICLSSRDDDILLIVSYAELKRCVDAAFDELTQHSSSQPVANQRFS